MSKNANKIPLSSNPGQSPQPQRMDPVTIAVMVTTLISLIRELVPQIQSWKESGEIDEASANKVRDEYMRLRQKADGQFTGSEFKPSGR